MSFYSELKIVKASMTTIINDFTNGDVLIGMFDSNVVLSISNFKDLKNKIIEEKLLDVLNTILISYSIYRVDIIDRLSIALDGMYYTDDDKVVSTEIIEYKKLSESDKRLFELAIILNTI